jgi:hypothetical protein
MRKARTSWKLHTRKIPGIPEEKAHGIYKMEAGDANKAHELVYSKSVFLSFVEDVGGTLFPQSTRGIRLSDSGIDTIHIET